MCGIAGLIGFKGDAKANILKMNERMLHRGPDDGGVYISEDGFVALGHRRLSIVDLSKNGAQPMTSHSGRLVMVYNGEIYNVKELRTKLENVSFRGTSDTEVLLESIERFGVPYTLEHSKGMFAFAVYDKEAQTVTFARDRVGEKPLYYGTVNGAFAFASDIGCLRVIDGFNNKIDTNVLDMYFADGYIPAPYSIYEGIKKLEPGTIMTLNLKTLSQKTGSTLETLESTALHHETYWSMTSTAWRGQQNLFKGSSQEAADELERLLKNSIKDQMIADVPLGAFLSAGIDSSTVVSLMQSLAPGKVRTFTIGMEDPKFNEAVIAKEIANHLGTDHTELYITEDDAKAVIPKLPGMFGEPFADSSQIPTYLVSKMTRDHVTVSLSGDGGDELFCGYRSYESVSRVWNKISRIPYPLRKIASLAALGLTKEPINGESPRYSKALYLGAKTPYELHRFEHETDPIVRKIALKNGSPAKNRAAQYQYKCMDLPADFLGEVNHEAMLMDMVLYHPDDILVKVDRTAMACSLETRVPMLDKDVVEFAWTLPIDYLRDDKVGKKVLRDVLYRYVPKEMVERPKKGFSIPIAKWLTDPAIREWAEELLNEDKLRQQGLLDPEIVRKIWTDFTLHGIYRVQIWYILMFQQWYENEYKPA
ncbi:asparagine synthase (glutamine-hydrolyzing) [Butyrivibrio sp. FCS014]|uniref:asparagine synthase (glutamine-hydrolyzing) n=1 Tax=Butyrivibrio sp. FCS014 TaxID=1408304 RepID=UPI000464BA39|nr:asparagine synthase (glutamine-hydrolyzing) [Butyrivibrio sp. FCS014]